MITTFIAVLIGIAFVVTGLVEKNKVYRFVFVLFGAIILTAEAVKIWRMLW